MKKILIIEDDPAISIGLVDALKEENYQTMDVDDGEKGYQLAKDENYDLIVLDLMLPGKNGMDVCKDLRSDGVHTPIIMWIKFWVLSSALMIMLQNRSA
jgi:DNA-binding response OmpR family regulator